MPNKRRSSIGSHNYAQQIIAMDKLDRKIEETHDKYKTAIKASYILKAIQTFLALLVPIVAFIPNDNMKYATALLGAIVGALTGVDLKKHYGREAGKQKAHYDSLVKERHEFIKREGPYVGMGYSMRVRQVSWRTENCGVIDSSAEGMMTPASSVDDVTMADDENPRMDTVRHTHR